MSTQVDNYVASMEFDNSKFEKNVATSMSTLEKLKQKLNLDGASKGLEEINAAAGKVNMSGLGSGVDAVKAKFSALDVVAVTALANITNKAVDAGEKLVKSLSVDQLTAGWQKFSDKTTSVATLVAQGNAIEDVNAQLDRLNWFTDETSYNFTEMVANIAKFTATGKGLNESVTAMEGIATWAALSGQNAATASRAMYQLSQAMGAGVMRLEDYKSIQNASMDTEEFRQKCLDAAVSLGTLKDNGDGTYQSLISGADDASFNISQFTSQLTKGMWLTSDVMMQVFTDYSAAVEGIYEAAEEKGMLASEVIDEIYTTAEKKGISTDEAIKSLGYDFDSFALKAFEAAQKARTFSDAIDSVKDAVSTGWMNTFELLFGDAEQATKLWTEVANQLYDIFAGGGESRNSILETTMTSGWDKLVERINDAGIETSDYEQALRECAEAGGEDVDGLIKKYGSLSEVFKNGALSTDYLKKAFGNLSITGEEVKESLDGIASIDFSDILPGHYGETTIAYGSDAVESVKKIQTALLDLGYTMADYGADGKFGPKTWQAVAKFQKEMGLSITGVVDKKTLAALEEAHKSIETIGTASSEATGGVDDLSTDIDDLVDSIARPSGQELLFDTISNSLTAVSKVVETFREAWSEIFTDERATNGLYNALTTIQKASENLVNFLDTKADKLKSTFKGVIAIFDILTSIVGGALKAAFQILGEIFGSTNTSILDITGSVGDAIVWFRNWLAENELITKGFDKLVSAANKVITIIEGWVNAFKKIPFVNDLLNNIKQLFSDISSDVNDGTDKVEKWVGAFDGLAFVNKVLDKIGKAFDWIGSVVEDAIIAIGPWFETFKNTEGVQQLVSAVTDLVSALGQLFNGDIDANEFASVLGKSLANILTSLPKMAIQIGKDFIAGFTNGLGDGIGEVIDNILEFCSNFISAFAEALGIHSPSTIAYDDGVDWVQGFINGISSMLEPLKSAVQPIIDFITGVFKSFWGYITDENGEIEWDKIFAGAITIESLAIALKFAEAFQTLANAMSSFSGIFSSIKGVFSSLSTAIKEVGKAAKWDLTASAVMKMAIAVGILAAAIFLLAKIDDIGKLWNAVGVIAVLALIVVGLAFAMSKLGDASISFSAAEKKLDVNGMKTTILQLGIALLLLAAAVKIIGTMEANEAEQGLISLAAMVGGMIVFMAAIGGISLYAKDLSKFSSMMTEMAVAMLLLVVVIKMVGKLDESDILKGVAFMAAFAIFTVAIGSVTALCGEHVSKFGSMMTKLAIAMGLMVLVCKMVNKLSAEEALKGAAFAAAFVIFVGALVKVTTIGSEQKLAEVGGVILSAGVAILLMAAACKIVSSLSWGEIAKGLTCVVAFGLVLAALIALLKIGNEQKMGQVAGSLIGASVAILIMAGTAVILSMIPLEDLWKGVVIVAVFGLIVAAMVKSLKGAENAQKAITAMAVCIAVMAAAVVALSFLDTTDLAACTAAMVLLMGSFALIIKSMSGLEKGKISTGALITLAGVLILIAGLITVMTHIMKDSTSAIAAGGALSMVILAFAAAFKLMNKVRINKTVSDNLVTMAGCMAILGLVLGLMSAFPHASSMIENAVSLGILINCLASAMLILNNVKLSKTVTDNLLLMSGCMAILGLVLGLMSAFPHASSMIENAVSLGILINCLASAMLILNNVKLSKTVTDNLLLMSGCMAILGFVLGLMSAFPHASSMIENAVSLGILINCLASAMLIASLAGPNAGPAASAMLVMAGALAIVGIVVGLLTAFDIAPSIEAAVALSTLLLAMSAACLIVSRIPSAAAIDGAIGLAAFIGIMAAVIAAAGLLMQIPGFDTLLADGGVALGLVGEAIGNFVGGIIAGVGSAVISLIPQLGLALSVFAIGLQPFLAVIDSMSAETVAKAGFLTATIAALTATAFVEGITSLFGLGLPSLGADLAKFGMYVGIFSASLNGVNPESVEAAGNVASMILKLTAVDVLDGLTSWLTGGVNYDDMGANLKTFGEAVVGFSETISGKVDVAAVEAATNAGALLVELNKSLPRSGGWIQDIIGEQDFETFATACKAFANCILDINEAVSQEGFELQSEKIEQLVAAGTQFSELNNALPRSGGIAQDLAGEQDLAAFGVACVAFANCMIAISQAVSSDNFVVQSDKISQLVTAGTQFNELNTALPRTGGIAQDFAGEQDLARFGAAVAAFAACMILVNQAISQEGFSVNLEGIEQIKQAGLKMNELQSALPKSGGWWQDIAGEQDIGDFGKKIKSFADAIVDFSASSAGLDQGAISSCLSTVDSIKSLMTSLIDMDYSGVDAFTGVGTGGFGADGPAYDIACAIAKFGDKVADINTETVRVALTAAEQLKTLIAGLVGLDTSGIENFKPEAIGTQIKTYAEKVAGIDTSIVASSITSANRLKSFIAGLVDLDTSGISKFNVSSIGTSLSAYSANVAGFDSGSVTASITAAGQLKRFIASLAGLDTSGVASFKTAINELSTVNVAAVAEAFSGVSTTMATAGADMIDGLVKGMQGKLSSIKSTASDLASSASSEIKAEASSFKNAGETLSDELENGFKAGKSGLKKTASSMADAAKDSVRAKYNAFYSAGEYLVKGFAEGIKDSTWRAEAKARAMAKAAEDAARDELDINSPSKVFKKIGSGIPEGFAMGIGMLSGEVKQSVSDMASTAIDTTRSAMTTVLDALNSDMDAQPTIRPIVDLTDVRAGANSIGNLLNTDNTVGVMANIGAVSTMMNNRRQNGSESEVVSAINKLRKDLGNVGNTTYTVGNITYDDGSNVSEAVKSLVRAARVERRV